MTPRFRELLERIVGGRAEAELKRDLELWRGSADTNEELLAGLAWDAFVILRDEASA